jgi:hypothetical protein
MCVPLAWQYSARVTRARAWPSLTRPACGAVELWAAAMSDSASASHTAVGFWVLGAGARARVHAQKRVTSGESTMPPVPSLKYSVVWYLQLAHSHAAAPSVKGVQHYICSACAGHSTMRRECTGCAEVRALCEPWSVCYVLRMEVAHRSCSAAHHEPGRLGHGSHGRAPSLMRSVRGSTTTKGARM